MYTGAIASRLRVTGKKSLVPMVLCPSFNTGKRSTIADCSPHPYSANISTIQVNKTTTPI